MHVISLGGQEGELVHTSKAVALDQVQQNRLCMHPVTEQDFVFHTGRCLLLLIAYKVHLHYTALHSTSITREQALRDNLTPLGGIAGAKCGQMGFRATRHMQ